MFGFGRPRKVEVLNHWYALVPDFKMAPREFYSSIEEELKARQVPGLEMSRVEFSEGGVLSDSRQYLRMTRERWVFDICAAPFGTAYFFSCRFAEISAVIQLWHLLVVFIGIGICVPLSFFICAKIFGGWAIFVWPVGAVAVATGGIYTLRNAVAMGLRDLDAALIKSPLFGPIYEVFFRKHTYYREDTRLMYLDTVNEVVKAQVEDSTGAKGVKLLRFNEHDPILHELYRPRMVRITDQVESGDEPSCLASTAS